MLTTLGDSLGLETEAEMPLEMQVAGKERAGGEPRGRRGGLGSFAQLSWDESRVGAFPLSRQMSLPTRPFRLLQFLERDFRAGAHFTALFWNLPNQSQSTPPILCLVLFGFPSLNTLINTNMILPEEQQLFCLKIV